MAKCSGCQDFRRSLQLYIRRPYFGPRRTRTGISSDTALSRTCKRWLGWCCELRHDRATVPVAGDSRPGAKTLAPAADLVFDPSFSLTGTHALSGKHSEGTQP